MYSNKSLLKKKKFNNIDWILQSYYYSLYHTILLFVVVQFYGFRSTKLINKYTALIILNRILK